MLTVLAGEKNKHPETLHFIETSQSQARLCAHCNATCSFVVQLIGARLMGGFSVFTWAWLSVITCCHALTKCQVHCLSVRMESWLQVISATLCLTVKRRRDQRFFSPNQGNIESSTESVNNNHKVGPRPERTECLRPRDHQGPPRGLALLFGWWCIMWKIEYNIMQQRTAGIVNPFPATASALWILSALQDSCRQQTTHKSSALYIQETGTGRCLSINLKIKN